MKALSPRQQALFDWIEAYMAINGIKPMYKEMSHEFNIGKQAINGLLRNIEYKGWTLSRYGWVKVPLRLMKR